MPLIEPETEPFLIHIRATYPTIQIDSARLRTGEGQFNHIVVVNEQLIFRFPRTQDGAVALAREIDLLLRLQDRLPLPIPQPIYQGRDIQTGTLTFMGYPLIVGEPLWNEVLHSITDEAALDRMAGQLAGFLFTLHHLPVASIVPDLAVPNEVDWWATLHAQFQRELYSFMRPDAREATDALFAALLDDLRRDPPIPVLRHSDFGGGNVLYDPQTLTITGVIDFGFAGFGDPAVDIAAFSGYGEAFLMRSLAVYPAMAKMLPRARLYRQTYALQQALYALHDHNQADFEDGIRAYV